MAAPGSAAAAAAVETPLSLLNLADPAFWNMYKLEDRQRAARSFREYLAEQTKELRLSGCNLFSLPSELFELRDLEFLSVYDNQIYAMPPGLARLTNLHTLIWSHNNLRELPGDVLVALPNLRTLDVTNNALTSLPKKLFELRHLEELQVSYNHLRVMPHEMARLTNLKKLGWNRTSLRELPGDVMAALPNLRQLDVEHNSLSSLPSELFELQHLEILDVSENRLPAMPPELARLTSLKLLEWSNNNLRELPGDVLAALPNLSYLDVADNDLPSLPSELFELQLESLILNNCGVYDGLPVELWDMTTLMDLSIAACGLEEIPRAVGNLSKLARLEIHDNPLKELPAELGLLPALKMLKVGYISLEDAMEKQLATAGNYDSLLQHLRERARRELSGRLTKRASTTTADSEAGAGAPSKQEMSD